MSELACKLDIFLNMKMKGDANKLSLTVVVCELGRPTLTVEVACIILIFT